MSAAIIEWSRRASAQYHELSPDLQQNALALAGQLQTNPYIGERYNTITLPSGKHLQTYASYGLRLALRYRLKGWVNRRLVIRIEDVQPTDLLTIDQYEERRR